MTDPDFDNTEFDADFDAKDISSILSDIDNANLALDSLDGRSSLHSNKRPYPLLPPLVT
jgi:hypothetical protein